jgi:hypothetical protein
MNPLGRTRFMKEMSEILMPVAQLYDGKQYGKQL